MILNKYAMCSAIVVTGIHNFLEIHIKVHKNEKDMPLI